MRLVIHDCCRSHLGLDQLNHDRGLATPKADRARIYPTYTLTRLLVFVHAAVGHVRHTVLSAP